MSADAAKRVAQLEADVEQLREALKPFAQAWAEVERDDEPRSRIKNTWFFDDSVVKRAAKALVATEPAKERA